MTQLPQDVASERTVLGALMLAPEALADLVLEPSDFYTATHGRLFALMREMQTDGDPVEMMSVAQRVATSDPKGQDYGGVSYVASLPDHVGTAENLAYYAEIVRTAARRRRLILGLSELREAAADPDLDVDTVLGRVGALAASDASTRADTWVGALQLATEAASEWRERIAVCRSGAVQGIATGMPELDGLLNPGLPGKVTVVAARPAMGKSAFALNFALGAAMQGYHVGVVSLEMSRVECVDRLCVPLARVDANAVVRGQLSDHEYSRMMEAADVVASLPLWIDDQAGQTDADVRRRVRALHRAHGLDLVVVDYMQLMESDDGRQQSREAVVSAASRRTKALARELGVHVVSLSQLNRSVDARGDKRPMMSDLRESGAIEQDADRILFLYRDEYYNSESPDRGYAEVIVAKQRAGQTGTAKVRWSGALQRFGEDRWRR